MRFIIETPEDLVQEFERLAQNARENIGKTRTKLESNELKGQVMAFNEAIFYTKEFIKTLKEMQNAKPAGKVESVDSASYPVHDGADLPENSELNPKVKPV